MDCSSRDTIHSVFNHLTTVNGVSKHQIVKCFEHACHKRLSFIFLEILRQGILLNGEEAIASKALLCLPVKRVGRAFSQTQA